MNEDKSRASDYDLNKILEEYSAISKEKQMPRNTSNSPQRKQSEQKSKNYSDIPVSKNRSRDINSNYDSDYRKTQSNNPPKEKKFVLHIDESIINSQLNESYEANKKNNNGGIYFSNYQKSKYRRNDNDFNHSDNYADIRKVRDESESDNNTGRAKRKAFGGKNALIFLAVIIFSTALLSYLGVTCVSDMLAINRGENEVEVVIPENASYKDVIDILHDNDLVENKLFCRIFTKYRDFDEKEYNSGKYYLSADMGVEGMLREMSETQYSAETITLSFPEGYTVKEIFDKLSQNDVCETDRLYSTIQSNFTYSFYNEIEDNSQRYLKLEGYLFPDTYDFFVGADTNYVIKKFLDNFESKWTAEYQARAEKLGYTCDEIITIASIIQEEADNVEQMKIISSVIHNRLNNQTRYPTLGCDSTGIYVNNSVTPVVGEAMGMAYYNYYETNSNKGLPPGPICNPGMDAIKAALYPEESNYYFFAHDKNGKIYLAENLDQHNTNLVKIIKANNED